MRMQGRGGKGLSSFPREQNLGGFIYIEDYTFAFGLGTTTKPPHFQAKGTVYVEDEK